MTRPLHKSLLPDFIDRHLRAKVTLGIALPLVMILGAFTLLEASRHRSALLDNLSRLASYNGQLVEDALWNSMQKSDFHDVQKTLDAVGMNRKFRVVYLLDPSGRVAFSPNSAGVGTQLDNRSPACQACHKLPAQERPSSVVVTTDDGQRVFRSMQPIENSAACSSCHDPKERLIGLLLTDISVAPFEAALASDLRENLLWSLATILVTTAIADLALRRVVIGRLEKAAAALSTFGSGKRNVRLVPSSPDEIGQLESDFNEMVQQIQIEETENRALSQDLRRQTVRQQELLKRLITAQEDERKRVARELHDEMGQSLTGLALHSEMMEQFIRTDPKRALEQLSQTQEMIAKTSEQMYELILDLRPSILDDLGLAAALRSHADRLFAGNGITFVLDASKLRERLPASVEIALYRIFQEALSNIVKHSKAHSVNISLTERDGVFEGEIVDNGQGFDPEDTAPEGHDARGLGLLGMQERVALCSGSVDIVSRKGEGTRIRVRIPLAEADHE